ncbi:hypothetical protein BS17DRAFT_787845 [Gyrodon lividus]|nr:hypothetical protein BS17DRAFT_787845 [Gyrodon lividus]
MGVVLGPEIGDDLRKLLPDNPFVPPKGHSCPINYLPPELLSRIFEVGASDNEHDEEDEMTAQSWNHLDQESMENKSTTDDDIEMEGEEDEDNDEDTDEELASTATGSSDTSGPPFQIVVSHVCQHWRNVALSTPALWTSLVVFRKARPPYEQVSTLLERSKSLPIDIFIDCELQDHDEDFISYDESEPSEADLKFLFALLIPHVHRWRSMEVEVSSYEHMYTFLTAFSDPSVTPAPQLETFRLCHHEEAEEFASFANPKLSKHFTLFSGSAPSLKIVTLWGVHVDWGQGWIASASNLVTLELAYHTEDVRPSWTAFATILRGAPALEDLNLCLSGPSGDPAQWIIEPSAAHIPGDLNAPIQLLRLTNLVLGFYSPTFAIGLLRKLYTPALQSLSLDFDDGDYTEFITYLVGPATSLAPPPAHEQPRSLLSGLENLKISGLPCPDQTVEMLYGELKNLKSLNVSMSYLSNVFLDLLCRPCTLDGHSDTWLPRLKSLCVSGTSGDKIREVVRKRKDAGVPLQSLYVEESCDVDDEDVEWLKDNLEMFEFFEGSDDEDVIDLEEDMEDGDEWSDTD